MTTITKSQTTLTLGTEDGDVEIREDELPTITDEDLVMLGISRAELHRCFAEAAELMQGVDPLERKRAVADQRPDSTWEVHLVQYSPFTDPLMQGPAKGSA